MATSAEQEQKGFWEELEKLFDRQIPIKYEVRYAIDTIFKRLDVFDPEEREGVINAAEHIAYEIVTAAFRGGDAEEVQKEVIKNMSKEDKEKAEEDKKKAEEDKKKAEEDKKKAEEDKRKAEEDKKKAEEDKRKAEEDKEKAEEDKEKAEEDKKKAEEDKKKAEEDKKKAEEDKKKAEEDKKKAEEDKKKAEEDKRKAEEEGSQMSLRVATKPRARGDVLTPGNFLEMFEGIKKLPKKYEQKEAPKEEREKVHYLIDASIFRDILENIIEKEKDFLFENKFEDLLKMKAVQEINSKYSVDTETLEFYGLPIYLKCMMTVPEPPSVTHPGKFSEAKDRLIKSAIEMTHFIFESRQHGRTPILNNEKKKELTKKIYEISYPTSPGGDLGLFVDYTAYEKWKKGQSSLEVRLFNECVTYVREKLSELPDFVERWGNWVFEVSEQLKSEGSS